MITLRLDKNGGINKGDVQAFEHDNKSEVYIIQLYKNGAIYDLTNKNIELTMVERKRKIGDMVNLPIYEATEGKVKLEVVSDITKQDGIYDFKLTVKDTTGLIETFPNFQVEIKNDITDSITGEIIQDPNFTILTDGLKALADYEIYKTNALKVPEIEQDIVEINEQLDSCAKKDELDVERKRIDSFTTLTEGSTTGDAELIDSRIGENGVVYDNLGGALRNQIGLTNTSLYDISEICNFSESNVKGLRTAVCNIIKGRRYRIVVTTTSTTSNQFGTLDDTSNWADSSELFKNTLTDETIDFIATKSCSKVGVYNGTTGDYSIIVYELISSNDKLNDLEENIPNIIGEAINENNYKYILIDDLIVPNTECIGSKTFSANFIKGNSYTVKVYCESEETTTFQFGTVVNTSDSNYVDKTEVFDKIPSSYEWSFIATGNANYLLFYCSNSSLIYNIEVYQAKSVKDAVEKFQEQIKIPKNYKDMFKSKFTSEDSNYTLSNATVSTNGLTLQTGGYAYHNKVVYIDDYIWSAIFTFSNLSSKFGLYSAGAWTSKYLLDVTNRKLLIFTDGTNITTPILEKNITMPLNINTPYGIKLKRDGWQYELSIYNMQTMESEVIAFENYNGITQRFYQRGEGYMGVISELGQVICSDFKFTVNNFPNCKCLIIGNSLTEGDQVSSKNRYSDLIKDNIFNGNAIIGASGGLYTSGIYKALTNYVALGVKFDYCFVCAGMNDRSDEKYLEWETNIVNIYNKIVECGAVPIIAIPPIPKEKSEYIIKMRDFILNKGWITVRFDKALSLNNDGVTYNQAMFNSDGIHPNNVGDLEMYKEAKKTLSYLIL